MNIRASRLNDIPRIERVYRYCLPLFPQLIESFDLRNYDLIVSSSHCVAKESFRTVRSTFRTSMPPCATSGICMTLIFDRGGSLLARVGMFFWRRYLKSGTLRLRSGWITSWQTL